MKRSKKIEVNKKKNTNTKNQEKNNNLPGNDKNKPSVIGLLKKILRWEVLGFFVAFIAMIISLKMCQHTFEKDEKEEIRRSESEKIQSHEYLNAYLEYCHIREEDEIDYDFKLHGDSSYNIDVLIPPLSDSFYFNLSLINEGKIDSKDSKLKIYTNLKINKFGPEIEEFRDTIYPGNRLADVWIGTLHPKQIVSNNIEFKIADISRSDYYIRMSITCENKLNPIYLSFHFNFFQLSGLNDYQHYIEKKYPDPNEYYKNKDFVMEISEEECFLVGMSEKFTVLQNTIHKIKQIDDVYCPISCEYQNRALVNY